MVSSRMREHSAWQRREAGWIQSCASTQCRMRRSVHAETTFKEHEQQTGRPAEQRKPVACGTSKRRFVAFNPIQKTTSKRRRSCKPSKQPSITPLRIASEKYIAIGCTKEDRCCPSLASSDSKLAATPASLAKVSGRILIAYSSP